VNDAVPGPSRHVARLQDAIRGVCVMLENHTRRRNDGLTGPLSPSVPPPPAELGTPVDGSAFDALGVWFDLTVFEMGVVALTAGVEVSPDVASLCALAQGDPAMPYPTSLLALAALGGLPGASQAAFGPAAPLRYWKIVSTEAARPGGRLHLQLSLPDVMLSFLIGQPVLDDVLAALLDRLEPSAELPSDAALAHNLSVIVGADTVAHLVAAPTQRALGLAAAAADLLGFRPYHLPLARLTPEAERQGFDRLWQRDRLAVGGALILSFEEAPDESALAALGRLLRDRPGPLILIGASGQAVADRAPGPMVRVPLPPVDPGEVSAHLASGLPPETEPMLRDVADRFRLPLGTLESCVAAALAGFPDGAPVDTSLPKLLPMLRDQVREGMSGLADPVPIRLTLDDLVVPQPLRAVLEQIIARHRHRTRVLDDWGFRHSGGGAQGISVLFSGPSGTGKTMAAEALANALGLDLYRVDLSRIVDKYIGETEKRLAGLFDGADATDAILLFDEADALFGRRTEVRDSHDRYANLTVGYLLQRIESFRGIAVLTTNMPNAIDEAFARRFAFSLHFEFPTVDERREIWRRAIPASAPSGDLDFDKLARLSLSGGQIRVIAVNAAVLAADNAEAIGMPHIAGALVTEYAKQRRRVPPGDLEGWAL
jgi:hypothetical protein